MTIFLFRASLSLPQINSSSVHFYTEWCITWHVLPRSCDSPFLLEESYFLAAMLPHTTKGTKSQEVSATTSNKVHPIDKVLVVRTN